MAEPDQWNEDPPPDGAGSTLQVAAWHLQMLLASVASFDGKIMFLTALNVAGVSALIGILIAASPVGWLIILGFAFSGGCVALGLGALWSVDLQQFPGPDQILSTMREVGDQPQELAWRHFESIRDVTEEADAQLRYRIRSFRTLLAATPMSLTVVIATALTAAS